MFDIGHGDRSTSKEIIMDILRKELNSIYEAQHLDDERLPGACVEGVKRKTEAMVELTRGCAVITDASCDRCYIYADGFGSLMGISPEATHYSEVDSSDEDEIYTRLHPEDLVEKRMLEYEFFKMVDALPSEEKTRYKATCKLRMMDCDGIYRLIDNTTQIITLSPAGKIWLILCCYHLSTSSAVGEGIAPNIINLHTGEVNTLRFGDKRRHILTNREKEILQLIQVGKPSKQIAAILDISIHTVNRHRQNIIEKLSVGNSIEAITAATAMKLL